MTSPILFASLLLAGAGPAAVVHTPPEQSPSRCDSKLRHALGTFAASPRRLGEEPTANIYLAVVRQDAKGCLNPQVVRYGIGRR